MTTFRTRLATALAAGLVVAPIGVAVAGPSGGALPPVLVDVLQVGGVHGVPADAAMVAATVTSVSPDEPGWIKIFPCDQDEPTTANLNYVGEQIVNNLVLARLAADGTICVATKAVTDYVIDLAGYVPAGSAITPLANPVRALDTRSGSAGATPRPDGSTTQLQLGGAHGIPADATLAIFNLAAVGHGDPGYVTAHPCDTPPALTSSVNFGAGAVVANLVVSRLDVDGRVCFRNKGAADLVVDVAGYATGGIQTLARPKRILDTRDGGGPMNPAESSRLLETSTHLPDEATAAIYNLAVVGSPGNGYATAYPCREARPLASNLNHTGPSPVGAGSVTKLDDRGNLCIYTKNETHLIVDLIGYTTGTAHYEPLSPTRIVDTREGWRSTCDWLLRDPAPDGTVQALHLGTGELRRLELPERTNDHPGARPTIDMHCERLLWFVAAESADIPLGLYEVPIDGGEAVFWPLPASLEFLDTTQTTIHELDDGTVVYVARDGRLIDTVSGDVLWAGPLASGETLLDAAVSGDGIVAYLVGDNFGIDPTRVEIWDATTAELLSDYLTHPETRSVDVSRDGRYVSVGVPPIDDDPFSVAVLTVWGDVVDWRTAGFSFNAVFTGTGELAVCLDEIGYFRWELFGPTPYTGIPHDSTGCDLLSN